MAGFLAKLPFFKPKESIAVDVGTSNVKIAYFKQSGSKYSLVKWGIIPINESGAELSFDDLRNTAVTRIAEFFAKERIQVKNIITSISGHQVIVRYVHLTKLAPEQLSKTIEVEAEPYIPFDIRDVDLSFHILGDIMEEGQKKMETILVAAKKEMVQSRLDIFNDLNMRLVTIDIDAFALANTYELNYGTDASETVMLVNIGSSVTNMCIIENNVPRVVRDIFVSGAAFTKGVQRNMACDLKTAEDFKLRYSIMASEDEKEKTMAENQRESLQVSQALSQTAKELLTEVHRSIDFYISQNPERTIAKILLSGGTANLKSLDKFLTNELKIPVEIFNPLATVLGGETVPETVAPQLAVAVGLAMRQEGDTVS